MICAL